MNRRLLIATYIQWCFRSLSRWSWAKPVYRGGPNWTRFRRVFRVRRRVLLRQRWRRTAVGQVVAFRSSRFAATAAALRPRRRRTVARRRYLFSFIYTLHIYHIVLTSLWHFIVLYSTPFYLYVATFMAFQKSISIRFFDFSLAFRT
jgi:hypothetical protein